MNKLAIHPYTAGNMTDGGLRLNYRSVSDDLGDWALPQWKA